MTMITSIFADSADLSGFARPGAVRPSQDEHSKNPSNSGNLEVPAVVDRPLRVDEGETVLITEFRLLDAENLPEFGIDLSELNALLEDEKALKPKGFTVGQLQGVADVIEKFYRRKGLILAQAVIPVQTISHGIVDVQILVGKLGRILTEGNEIYKNEILKRPFRKLIGQPVSKSKIEAALLRLTDYSGLSAYGVFQPGLHVGTADLVIQVQEEKQFDVAIRADVHGTQETGRNRLRTIIDWNNISGFADSLTLTGQQSYHPKKNFFVSAAYDMFLVGGYKIGGFINVNAFDVGGEFADSQISSRSETQGVHIEKSFIRSRQKNFSASFGFTRKKSQTITVTNSTNRDRLAVFTLSADYDSVDTFSLSNDPDDSGGGINFAFLEFSHGVNNLFNSIGSHVDALNLPIGLQPSRQKGLPDGRFAAGQFSKVFASYTRLQTLRKNHSLLIRSEFQWAKDALLAIEQYAVGGPDNLRAFPVSQVLWDRAYFLSLEWLMNAPGFADKPAFDSRTWGELLQFSLFFEQASGRLNYPLPTEQQRHNSLRGVGLGLRFTLPGVFESKLSVATEIGGNDVGNGRNVQIWGDMTYKF